MSENKLTSAVVAALSAPEHGQLLIWDASLPGFGVRVTDKGRKTYVAQGRVAGRTVRVTIGRADTLTTEQARFLAKARLGDLAKGHDVNRAKKLRKVQGITLGAALKELVAARTALKPRTIEQYQSILDLYLDDWKDKPWTAITRQMVLDRHRKIGAENGKRTANNSMRCLRSVMNFCRATHRDPPTHEALTTENPVNALSDTKSWYPESRREDYLKPVDIMAWWQAVESLANQTQRDYVLMLLLTGTRGGELARLQWKNVDLKNRMFAIADSKNGSTIRLPVCTQIHSMLARRAEGSGPLDFVFPASSTSKTGEHVTCVNRLLVRVSNKTGIPMQTRHGLRRTYASIAEQVGVGTFTIKRLLGHVTTTSSDVTAGYVQFDIEVLRAPAKKITDFILKSAGVLKSADVIPLDSAAAIG